MKKEIKDFFENLKNALYGVFVTDKNARYEEFQEDSRRKYEAYIDFLVKENAELKDKIKQCNKLLYSDGISDSEVCSKIMEIL